MDAGKALFLVPIFWTLVHCQLAYHDQLCTWVVNVTDVQDLPHHRYMILEDCLYYKLSQEADIVAGKGNALVLLPPTAKKDDKVIFNVHDSVIRQVWMSDLWREMTINGYMTVSWSDYRLKWNTQKWKLDVLNIKTYGHLWVPDMNSERYQTAAQSNDFTMYHNIQASSNGSVRATFEYRMQSICETDFSNYPQDVNSCCFDVKSYLFEKIIDFKVWRREGRLDSELAQSNWGITDITVDARRDGSNAPYLRVCLKASRRSSTLKIELTVPMVVSAILVLIAPLFGTMHSQLYVKLFALLLQFLCFQFLVNRTPQIGMGDVTPKFYRFYEFTLVMTMVSLMITLLASALSRVHRSMPPPHRLVLLASALNNRVCCGSVHWEYETNSTSGGEHQPNGKQSLDYRPEWREIFIAANNAFSLLLVVTYFIGVIVLTA